MLDLPFVSVTPEALAQLHTLLVAADNRQLRDMALLPVLEQLSIFALNMHWLHRGGITPDIAGVMNQSFTLPWSGDMLQLDPETREITSPEPDTRPVSVIAQELAATEAEEDPYFDDTLHFYEARADFLKGGVRGGRARLAFHPDSPVPGSYFS